MILLDTHVWIWWIHGDGALPSGTLAALHRSERDGLAVSAISCWEVAKLVERGRLTLPMELNRWMQMALEGSGIQLIPLTPEIAVASTTLPGAFHRDPADQMIVATSSVHDMARAAGEQRGPRPLGGHVLLRGDGRWTVRAQRNQLMPASAARYRTRCSCTHDNRGAVPCPPRARD